MADFAYRCCILMNSTKHYVVVLHATGSATWRTSLMRVDRQRRILITILCTPPRGKVKVMSHLVTLSHNFDSCVKFAGVTWRVAELRNSFLE